MRKGYTKVYNQVLSAVASSIAGNATRVSNKHPNASPMMSRRNTKTVQTRCMSCLRRTGKKQAGQEEETKKPQAYLFYLYTKRQVPA